MGAQGTAALNFGAFPGTPEASVAVAGQTGLTSANLIEAFVSPLLTADHSVDEHLAESLKVQAVFTSAGQFRIYGWSTQEPPKTVTPSRQGDPALLHGIFNIGWVWN